MRNTTEGNADERSAGMPNAVGSDEQPVLPKFDLGKIVATPAALKAMEDSGKRLTLPG